SMNTRGSACICMPAYNGSGRSTYRMSTSPRNFGTVSDSRGISFMFSPVRVRARRPDRRCTSRRPCPCCTATSSRSGASFRIAVRVGAIPPVRRTPRFETTASSISITGARLVGAGDCIGRVDTADSLKAPGLISLPSYGAADALAGKTDLGQGAHEAGIGDLLNMPAFAVANGLADRGHAGHGFVDEVAHAVSSC